MAILQIIKSDIELERFMIVKYLLGNILILFFSDEAPCFRFIYRKIDIFLE